MRAKKVLKIVVSSAMVLGVLAQPMFYNIDSETPIVEASDLKTKITKTIPANTDEGKQSVSITATNSEGIGVAGVGFVVERKVKGADDSTYTQVIKLTSGVDGIALGDVTYHYNIPSKDVEFEYYTDYGSMTEAQRANADKDCKENANTYFSLKNLEDNWDTIVYNSHLKSKDAYNKKTAYTYRIRQTSVPEGYQVSTKKLVFSEDGYLNTSLFATSRVIKSGGAEDTRTPLTATLITNKVEGERISTTTRVTVKTEDIENKLAVGGAKIGIYAQIEGEASKRGGVYTSDGKGNITANFTIEKDLANKEFRYIYYEGQAHTQEEWDAFIEGLATRYPNVLRFGDKKKLDNYMATEANNYKIDATNAFKKNTHISFLLEDIKAPSGYDLALKQPTEVTKNKYGKPITLEMGEFEVTWKYAKKGTANVASKPGYATGIFSVKSRATGTTTSRNISNVTLAVYESDTGTKVAEFTKLSGNYYLSNVLEWGKSYRVRVLSAKGYQYKTINMLMKIGENVETASCSITLTEVAPVYETLAKPTCSYSYTSKVNFKTLYGTKKVKGAKYKGTMQKAESSTKSKFTVVSDTNGTALIKIKHNGTYKVKGTYTYIANWDDLCSEAQSRLRKELASDSTKYINKTEAKNAYNTQKSAQLTKIKNSKWIVKVKQVAVPKGYKLNSKTYTIKQKVKTAGYTFKYKLKK